MANCSMLTGGCLCGAVRYEVTSEPITLYACHCTDCQTASGSSFTLAMIVGVAAIEVRKGDPTPYERSRADGRKKTIFRCPACLTALWGPSPSAPQVATVYAGTLDDASSLEPVAHMWTRSAQPWVTIPEDVLNSAEQPPDMRTLAQAWKSR